MFSNSSDTEALEDCEVLGIPLDSLPKANNTDGIWHQNLPALEAFLDVATQWNRIGLANGKTRTVGLNYANAKAAWELAGIEVTPTLFGHVQIIEHAAIAEWNRK